MTAPLLCWLVFCSRAVAYRFGQYLDLAVPLVARFCKSTSDGEEELSESCLQARFLLPSHGSKVSSRHRSSEGGFGPHYHVLLPDRSMLAF